MDSDPEMTKSAARAYLQGKEKKYVSEQEIDDLLKDWIIQRNTIDIPLKFFSIATEDL